ncbi:MAG: DUF4352 domain-containing protein [Methanocorpusculum sp.]|nr:DUF4352 domain-containing protein [Methanocorpusculum sp.]
MKKSTKIGLIVAIFVAVVIAISIGFLVYEKTSEYTNINGKYVLSDNSGTFWFTDNAVKRIFDGVDIYCISYDRNDENPYFFPPIVYAGNGMYYFKDKKYSHDKFYFKLYNNGNTLEINFDGERSTLTRVPYNYKIPTTSAFTKSAYTHVPTPAPTQVAPQLSLSVLDVIKGKDAENEILNNEYISSIGGSPTASAKEKAYLVKVRLTNTSSKTLSVFPLFYLKMYVDGVGYLTPQSVVLVNKYPYPDYTTIGYGESVTGWMYYIVPNTETPKIAYVDSDIKSNSVPVS